MPTSDIKVFAGSSNPELARQVSTHLEMPLGQAKIGRFSDGEVMVDIDESVRGLHCFVLQSTWKKFC